MKELDELKQAVRIHCNKLEKQGLHVDSIHIEYTRQAQSFGAHPEFDKKPDNREVVIKLSTKRDSASRAIWI